MLSYLSHPHCAIMLFQSYISSIRICHLIALLPGEYYPSHNYVYKTASSDPVAYGDH